MVETSGALKRAVGPQARDFEAANMTMSRQSCQQNETRRGAAVSCMQARSETDAEAVHQSGQWVGVRRPPTLPPPHLLPCCSRQREKYYAAAGLPLSLSDSLPNFKLPSC